MYTYNLTKEQLIDLLNQVEKSLANTIQEADQAAKNYSNDPQSRLAFEVGYLGGHIKTALDLIRMNQVDLSHLKSVWIAQ